MADHKPIAVRLSTRAQAILREEAERMATSVTPASLLLTMIATGQRDRARARNASTPRNTAIRNTLRHTWMRLKNEPVPGRKVGYSLVHIGKLFGYHHTTVLHGIRKLEAEL